MRIAVDFDGTIVEHQFPRIGRPIENAIEVLKKLNAAGHTLIMWTYRHGETLENAVQYCNSNGVEFYAINASEPNEAWEDGKSRLIDADVFIDDRNVGGLMDWTLVEKELL
mgnify:FL=1